MKTSKFCIWSDKQLFLCQVSNELDESPDKDRYRRGASGGPGNTVLDNLNPTEQDINVYVSGSLPVSKKSLVYIQPSPDYCQDDPKVR